MASSPEPKSDDPDGDAGDEAGDDVRWPLIARVGVVLAALTIVGGIAAAVVAAFVLEDDGVTTLVAGAVDPVAPTVLSDGRLVYAERTTGMVRAVVEASGEIRTEVVASVPDALATEGQRGLLGLAARDEDGTPALYGTWTRAGDGRIVVGRLLPEPEVLWEGPVSTDLANGGTLAFLGDRLLVALGELQDPDAAADPATPNGKLSIIDPSGGDEVEVFAGAWHNPYAMTVVDGEVWLVDNAPGSDPERFVRVVANIPVETELAGKRAPAALALLPDGTLGVCGFVSGVVERVEIPDDRAPDLPPPPVDVVGPPCATGLVVTPDGDLVTTTADAVLRSGM